MKVLILTTVMAPYRVNLFNELGKKCNLVVCFEQKKDIDRNEKWYQKDNEYFKSISLKKWDKDIKCVKTDIISVYKEENPDFVVFYEYSTNTAMYFMQYCINKKIPYCINCDGAFINHNFIKDKVKKHFIKHAKACLANGKHAREYFLAYGAKEENIFLHKFTTLFQREIIMRKVSNDEKQTLKSKLKIPYKRVYISVGSFIYRKGYDLLLMAAKLTKSNDTGFIIIGGGEKQKEYEEYIKYNQLDNVQLIGYKDKKEIIEYYDVADIFIFPTREDIWGLVINEAMSRGLPIISTNMCIAAKELVEENKNGKIIRANSIDELVNAIREFNMLSPHDLEEMGYASIEKNKDYTIENLANSHLEVFEKIYEEKKKNKINLC